MKPKKLLGEVSALVVGTALGLSALTTVRAESCITLCIDMLEDWGEYCDTLPPIPDGLECWIDGVAREQECEEQCDC